MSGVGSASRILLILCCAWLGTDSAQAAAGLDAIPAWAGRYPSEALAGKTGLLGQPALKSTLRRILPAAEQQLLRRLTVETPVERQGDYLIADFCRPHNCPAEMAMLVVAPASGKVWVAFASRAEGAVSMRIYGNEDDGSALPPEILKAFHTRHGD